MKNTIALTMAITVGGFVHLGAQAQNLSIAMEQAWSRHPLAAASAPLPPSRAAILFSKTSVVGFIMRV
mgnify:CR=1 FL=1